MSLENGQTPGEDFIPGQIDEPEQLSFRDRLGNIGIAIGADYRESHNKLQNAAIGAGVLALQGLDRARASVVFVPTIAVHVFQNSHSPAEAAVAGGLAFATWCTAVGGITTEGLHQYPRAVKEFETGFPGFVDFFNDALPGIDPPTPEERDETSLAKRIGSRVLTGIKRGFTVSGIGTVAYVSTATVKGKSKPETHKMNLHASLDGGTAVGAIIFGAGEGIVRLAHSDPILAERIQNDASNIKLWYGVAGAMMLGQFVSNRLKKFRRNRQAGPETQQAATSDEPA
jgi:hypothetical protein